MHCEARFPSLLMPLDLTRSCAQMPREAPSSSAGPATAVSGDGRIFSRVIYEEGEAYGMGFNSSALAFGFTPSLGWGLANHGLITG